MCVIVYCCWVLLGLGWVLPIMLLILHVTCSCIRSFFSFLFWTCVVFFVLSLSLSLSLSWIDCVMAPKQRKSTPTRNPLQGSRSSSFVPSHIWFHDEKAKKDFSKNFQARGVHPKRQVILSDFIDTPLPKVVRTRVGLLYLRNPWDVPSCLYKSFTPTYMASIPLCLSLLLHSKAHVL